jgi:hypothetical protein
MFFAEELPTSLVVPEQAVTIVIVLGTFLFLLNIACAILIIVSFSRRKPAIEAEFATKKEMAAGFARVDAEIVRFDKRNEELARQIFSKLDDIVKSFDHGMREVHRAIGRLEGSEK